MDSSSVSASSARARSRGFSGEQEVRRFERWELGTISLTKDKSLLSAFPICLNYCRSFLLIYLLLPKIYWKEWWEKSQLEKGEAAEGLRRRRGGGIGLTDIFPCFAITYSMQNSI